MRQNYKILALLGPTNTGKTFNAIKRMLGYDSGIIGLPLRLLAREVFDKLTEMRGSSVVALVTGEERIIPKKPKYWVCTVEAMPMDLGLEFVAIDEIQLCSDHERGHIFTDRLLNARGKKETMFMGSETILSKLKNLLPEVEIQKSERFSELTYVGRNKISKIPERSAVVSFAIHELYAIAELIRRQKGGAAVIMGALSPRTRNAQVELYKNGDVDYLVATDAIGMGLNLDLRHVSFSKLSKYDGKRERKLYATELAQIAGRAGRFRTDGTFGVTGEAENLDAKLVSSIENSNFSPTKFLQWRNSSLNFSSVKGLIESLERKPTNEHFVKAQEGIDLKVLKALSDSAAGDMSLGSVRDIKLFWEVCQIPDFRKISDADHTTLLSSIFNFLKSDGILPDYWLHDQIKRLDRLEGDIDTLSSRLAFIRTWTFVSNKRSWLNDASGWQAETRLIEDKLSDELHRKLTQRFVDRRTSVLVKGLKQRESLVAEINQDSQIFVDGQLIGKLVGLTFKKVMSKSDKESKTIRATAVNVLGPQYHLRSEKIYNSSDEDFLITDLGEITWQSALVGKLKMGPDILSPIILPIVDTEAGNEISEKLKRRLEHFIERTIGKNFELLVRVREDKNLVGLSRGIAFRLVEALGVVSRSDIASDIKSLDQKDRAVLRKHGIRFGQFTIFNHLMLKPAPTKLRLLLHTIISGKSYPPPPLPGLVTIPVIAEAPPDYYIKAGYKLLGTRAIRVDMLERLSDLLRVQDIWNGFEANAEMLSITGLSLDQFADIMDNLGYVCKRNTRKKTTLKSDNLNTNNKVGSDPTLLEKNQEEEAFIEDPVLGSAGKELDETVEKDEIFYVFRFKKPKRNIKKDKTSVGNLETSKTLRNKRKNNKMQTKRKENQSFNTENVTHSSRLSRNKRSSVAIDPDSPFAALIELKNRL